MSPYPSHFKGELDENRSQDLAKKTVLSPTRTRPDTLHFTLLSCQKKKRK